MSSRRIQVSFKRNDRDTELLRVVNLQNDKSNFVKNCIEFYLKNQVKEETKQVKRKIKF